MTLRLLGHRGRLLSDANISTHDACCRCPDQLGPAPDRESGALAGVVDFDKALLDPERPTQMLPIYDCGDGLHPSDRGYCKMGDEINLALFDQT